jgi:hypothetical protein
MNPEPLKDKRICEKCGCTLRQCKTKCCCPDCEHCKSNLAILFDGIDIHLAVEWLKQELYMPHATQDIRDWMNNKIDEAFEDVTKEVK